MLVLALFQVIGLFIGLGVLVLLITGITGACHVAMRSVKWGAAYARHRWFAGPAPDIRILPGPRSVPEGETAEQRAVREAMTLRTLFTEGCVKATITAAALLAFWFWLWNGFADLDNQKSVVLALSLVVGVVMSFNAYGCLKEEIHDRAVPRRPRAAAGR